MKKTNKKPTLFEESSTAAPVDGVSAAVPAKPLDSVQGDGEGPSFVVIQPPTEEARETEGDYPEGEEEQFPDENGEEAEGAQEAEAPQAPVGAQAQPQSGNKVLRGGDMAKNVVSKLLAYQDSFGTKPFQQGAGEGQVAISEEALADEQKDPQSPLAQFKLIDKDPASGDAIYRHPVSGTELVVPGSSDVGGLIQITVRPAGPREWGGDPIAACQRLEKAIEKMPQLKGQAWVTKDNGVVVEDVTPDEAKRVYKTLLSMGFRDKDNGVGWEAGVPKIGKPAEGVVRPPKWDFTWPATLVHEDGDLTAEWSAVDAGKPGAKLVIRFGAGKPQTGGPAKPGAPGQKPKPKSALPVTKAFEEDALALLELEAAVKHYGPGNHPDGSPQKVHGQRGGQAAWRRKHGVDAQGRKLPQYDDYSDPEDEDLPDPDDPREKKRVQDFMEAMSDEARKERLTPHFPAGTPENEFEAGANQIQDFVGSLWTDGKQFYGTNIGPRQETALRGILRGMGFDVFASHGWAGDNRVLTRKSDGATASLKFKRGGGLNQVRISFSPGNGPRPVAKSIDLAEEAVLLADLASKHYGPGPHRVTGTSQDVHGGDSNGNVGQIAPQQTPKARGETIVSTGTVEGVEVHSVDAPWPFDYRDPDAKLEITKYDDHFVFRRSGKNLELSWRSDGGSGVATFSRQRVRDFLSGKADSLAGGGLSLSRNGYDNVTFRLKYLRDGSDPTTTKGRLDKKELMFLMGLAEES